jgi:ABC-2 type transport system ATP-binding protein
MYVKEYLEFIAGIHSLGKKTKPRIHEMIEITGLQLEQHKKIGALSKGYRQRVGLAQALIHDPKVLILDEPTTGLDPNQLAEIRELIRNVGKEKTVLLSTHIMQEVKAVCDRVIIINKGNIVANDTAETLQNTRAKQQVVRVEFDKQVSKQKLTSITGIDDVVEITPTQWKLIAYKEEDIRPTIFQFAVANQLAVLTLQKEEQSLEEVFKQLTQ